MLLLSFLSFIFLKLMGEVMKRSTVIKLDKQILFPLSLKEVFTVAYVDRCTELICFTEVVPDPFPPDVPPNQYLARDECSCLDFVLVLKLLAISNY